MIWRAKKKLKIGLYPKTPNPDTIIFINLSTSSIDLAKNKAIIIDYMNNFYDFSPETWEMQRLFRFK